jgi:pyruvate formate lyase activating enzyme
MQCGAGCLIAEGERGFCGLRTVREGKLRHLAGTRRRGVLHWYRDPLPTNCVADWVCSGSLQRGKHNLAVFYASCTLDCLFCQNWHFREVDIERSASLSADDLADRANPETFCVCFFGGDPASQMPHAITAGRLLAERGVTVCWETAGTANARMMDRAVRLSLESGGIVKFDLKAFTEPLHVALTGLSNRQTLDNFTRAAGRIPERGEGPLVIASTLLVPGYVDAGEVRRIASFIARHDRDTPYSLLAFAPGYLMRDLPRTSRLHAEEARRAALDAGLTNVHVGNLHLIESTMS